MKKYSLTMIVLIQVIILFILVCGDIGFDFPGRLGLSFDHAIILITFYVVTFLIGIISAVKNRKWVYLLLQSVIPIILFFNLASW